MSRNRLSLNGTYPELVAALAAQTCSKIRRRRRDRRIRRATHEFRAAAGRRLGVTSPDESLTSGIPVFY
jgi:hypothetical protein